MAKSKKPHSETWWRVLVIGPDGRKCLSKHAFDSERETQEYIERNAFLYWGVRCRVVQVRETVIEKRKGK